MLQIPDGKPAEGAKIVVFPELCITGYTCNDLFLQETLLEKAREALLQVALFLHMPAYLRRIVYRVRHPDFRGYCRHFNTIASIGKKDIQEMIDEGESIEVNCQFCDRHYVFTPQELGEI